MYELIAQPRELIGEFVAQMQGTANRWGDFTALGVLKNRTLVAGVVYNRFDERNVCMHVGAEPASRWLTRDNLHAFFDYPFNQFGANRVTAPVARKNHHCRKFVQGIGFRLEGKMRSHFDGDDLMIYGMLREECRWLVHGTHEALRKAA